MKKRKSRRVSLFALFTIMVFCLISFYKLEMKSGENNNQAVIADPNNIEEQAMESTEFLAGTRGVSTSTVAKKKQYVVVVDAGHGGIDAGAMGPSKSKEKDNTLAVALKLGKLLESKGIKVIYTRKSDKTNLPNDERSNLQARTSMSDNAGADLFISIHNNSSPFKSIRGVETYYFGGSTQSKSLANSIQAQIVSSLKLKDRGVRSENFYVLRNTKATSVLVELGFISNNEEEGLLNNTKSQDKYAQSIAAGIYKYLNIN